MLVELAIATVMVLLTVMFHGAGLMVMTRLLRIELREEAERNITPFSLRALGFTIALVLGLFALHAVEIWAYAALYLELGALPDLRSAVFFSTITFATIGYDDDMLNPAWQIVAAIEGINGVILMGWSTAFFVTGVTRLMRR
jgi:hypothetical protein